MNQLRTLRLLTTALVLCLVFLPVLAMNASANVPPDPKFTINADTLTIGENGEMQIDEDDWILFDATTSGDADGKIMYYYWTIKTEDLTYFTDADGRTYRNTDTGEATLKVKFDKEGRYDIILFVGDDGTAGTQETSEYQKSIEVKNQTHEVEGVFIVVLFLSLFVLGTLGAGTKFGKTQKGKKGKKGQKKGRKGTRGRKPRKGEVRRMKRVVAAAPRPAVQSAPQSSEPAKSFQAPEGQLLPYKQKVDLWESQNIDVSVLKQVLADVETGVIGLEVVDNKFAGFGKLVEELNSLRMTVNEFAEVKGYDAEKAGIATFNDPLQISELRAMVSSLSEKVKVEKHVEEEIGYKDKPCAKCHEIMRIPNAPRPLDYQCVHCQQKYRLKAPKGN